MVNPQQEFQQQIKPCRDHRAGGCLHPGGLQEGSGTGGGRSGSSSAAYRENAPARPPKQHGSHASTSSLWEQLLKVNPKTSIKPPCRNGKWLSDRRTPGGLPTAGARHRAESAGEVCPSITDSKRELSRKICLLLARCFSPWPGDCTAARGNASPNHITGEQRAIIYQSRANKYICIH